MSENDVGLQGSTLEFGGADIEAVSLAWEAATGADSIATIERVYPQSRSGAHVCIYLDCSFTRRDPVAIWRHVHGSHGEPSLPPSDFDVGRWL